MVTTNTFFLHNGKELYDIEDFIKVLLSMSDEQFTHHVHDGKNDFSHWMLSSLHEPKLAQSIQHCITVQEMRLAFADALENWLLVEEGKPRERVWNSDLWDLQLVIATWASLQLQGTSKTAHTVNVSMGKGLKDIVNVIRSDIDRENWYTLYGVHVSLLILKHHTIETISDCGAKYFCEELVNAMDALSRVRDKEHSLRLVIDQLCDSAVLLADTFDRDFASDRINAASWIASDQYHQLKIAFFNFKIAITQLETFGKTEYRELRLLDKQIDRYLSFYQSHKQQVL